MTTRRSLAPAVGFTMLLLAAPARAEAPDPARLLGMVQSYLEVMNRMAAVSQDPRLSLLVAQNSIKELYEQKGKKADAAAELRKILDGVEDPSVRTALRFGIADVYKETGQPDRALEELRALVSENKARLGKGAPR